MRPIHGLSRSVWIFRPTSASALLMVAVALLVLVLPGEILGTPSSVHGEASSPISSSISSPVAGHPLLTPQPPPVVPVHVHPLGMITPDSVNPTGYYSSEPAPMGIADFGVGHLGNSYTYETSEFLGNFTWTRVNIQGAQGTRFTDQLNVVLQFVQNGITYAYWIQDVAGLDSSNGLLSFENNIWNLSSSSGCLSSSGVSGNGTVYPYSGCQGYYAEGANSQPGAIEYMPSPGDFQLLARSYVSTGGLPEVAFEYRDGVTSWYVTFDNVVWPWARAVSADDNFVVDGSQYTPDGMFYDAELALGGPGGGSSTSAQRITQATSQLLFWNGHNFQAPISAWNFGSDTAETISNVQSIWTSDLGGTPLTLQLNGTTFDASTYHVYDQDQVGFLHISAPSVASGQISVRDVNWSFIGGQATFTLNPGKYSVWVNSSTTATYLGLCTVVAGGTVSTVAPGGCTPSASTPRASRNSADVGQAVNLQTTPLSMGSGGDTYSWSVTPNGLGCGASTATTLACDPTATGSYQVNVTVTDSLGQLATSGNLTYVVYPDLSVTAPSPNRSVVETGGSVTFTVHPTGGLAPYTYSWSGLPTPCVEMTGPSPTCQPTSSGAYSIALDLGDSNGYRVVSPSLGYTVEVGPSPSTPTATPTGSVDVGQPVTFTTSVTGGTGSYTYSWNGLPAGCSPVDLTQVTCKPTKSGSAVVSVSVVDTGGGNGTSGPLSYPVSSDPVIVANVSPGSVDIGQSTVFSVVATGGSGGYHFAWSGLPTGCVGLDSTTISCFPIVSGAFDPIIRVSDSNGWVVNETIPVVVSPAPSVGHFDASPSELLEGSASTFSVEIDGGHGQLSYNYSGLPPGCASENLASFSCTPTQSGTFTVVVTVTDENGMRTTARISVTVDPELLGLPAFLGYLLLAMLVITGIVLAILFLERRRRRGPHQDAPTMVERIRGYSPQSRASPVQHATMAPSEVWAESPPYEGGQGSGQSDKPSFDRTDSVSDPVH